jgi:hypothetical protein
VALAVSRLPVVVLFELLSLTLEFRLEELLAASDQTATIGGCWVLSAALRLSLPCIAQAIGHQVPQIFKLEIRN